ncbi:hypothetical protein NST83_03885 [Paenibacillus sp. FSL R10-2782]|uniref:hypothetical protein n=1 Tax=Paenibacillus sp. FSL R10-2782 TaxID=2954661 RepID=UPI0031591232
MGLSCLYWTVGSLGKRDDDRSCLGTGCSIRGSFQTVWVEDWEEKLLRQDGSEHRNYNKQTPQREPACCFAEATEGNVSGS